MERTGIARHIGAITWAVITGLLVGLASTSETLLAQSASSSTIQGKVADATGGAIPGVTVTLTSPALQIPQLVEVTNAAGEYRFFDLRPGIYKVTYELAGFQTVIRDEQRLNAGFAARMDVVMAVGTVEETVRVSGQAPVVDVSTTKGSTNFTKETLANAPVVQTMWQVLALTPGVRMTGTPDVGGSTVGTQQGYTNYGTTDQVKPELDGIDTREQLGAAGSYYDERSFEEVQVSTVGNDAEMALPGTNYVAIIKSGGNEFHGTYYGSFERPELQGDNLDDALRAQGISDGNPLKHYWDLAADLGGRLVRDKLWFYGAYRNHRTLRQILGFAEAPGPDQVFGTADDVPGTSLDSLTNYTAKLSYQPSQQFKAIGYVMKMDKWLPHRDGTRFRPAESTYRFAFPTLTFKGEVQGMPNDQTLWNVVVGRHEQIGQFYAHSDIPGNPSRFNRNTGIRTGPNERVFKRVQGRWMSTASFSYFPTKSLGGNHSFKTGVRITNDWFGEEQEDRQSGNYYLVYDVVNGVPNQPAEIVFNNAPITGIGSRMREYSGYFKDTWSVNQRLTANLGFRWEYYHSYVLAATKKQGPFGNSGEFPFVDVLTWFNAAPRLGVAYDLTGDGKTVVKATAGWFNHTMGSTFANSYNKNFRVETTYRWRDPDGNNDYTPGEVDLSTSSVLSVSGATNNIINRDLKQPRTYELSLGLDRELMADFGARVLYVYKTQQNLYEDVNVLRPYGAYSIPITRRDPGPDGLLNTPDDAGSVTFYDYSAAYRGADFIGTTRLNSDRENTFQTIELTLNKRTSHNWDMLASFFATWNHRWIDLYPGNPNEEFFPLDTSIDWALKLIGGYEFPKGIRFGVFYQYISGDPIQRTYVFRQADPDGGTPISQSNTVTLRLEPFDGSKREPNLGVMNFRATKRFQLPNGRRFGLEADLFNVLNANTASTLIAASGPTYGYTTTILPPRIARVGATFSF
jgi:hypothetical protein